MNFTALISTVVGIVLLVLILWLFLRRKLKFKELKLKAPSVEVTLEGKKSPDSNPNPQGTQACQLAIDNGKIDRAEIEAPAQSGAKLGQKATGKGSRISDSKIKLS